MPATRSKAVKTNLLSALILAGGESRRMGRDKAWVEFKGKPLLLVALEKIGKMGVSEVFISGREDKDYSAFNHPVLLDLEPGSGPMGGIERGLQACANPLLFVLAVDLPLMPHAFLQKLGELCGKSTGIVPKLAGRLEPLVAVYPKRCHVLAFESVTSSRPAVQDFAKACLEERAVRTYEVSPAEAEYFSNWNSPGDLRG